jgi:hypothetical protein
MTECTEHDHTQETPAQPKQITQKQFRELRGKYFTVRHPRVKDCGHHQDQINEPTFRNCEYCWFAFLETHPELVKVVDEAYVEHGAAFIDKMRGVKFRKMFCRYMATKLKLQKEKETNDQTGKVQSSGSLGEGDGQGERGNGDLSTTGEPSESTYTLDSDQPDFD